MIKSAEGGKPLKKAPFLALVAVIVLLIGMWPPWPAGSQTTGITSQTQVVNSTAAAGTSSVIALDGKYSNCTVIAQTSTSTASVVVYGNTQATQYGPAAPNAVNSNFGSSGTITATTTQSQTSGNVANLPVGFYFTWSGNSGTLYAWAVCSSAIARAAAGATGAPGPTGPTGPPGPTGSPGAVPTFAANAPIAVATTATTVTYSFTGPLSVANGGTGTAAPAPTSSNGCTVTGTWPSQTFACPTAAAGGVAPSASPPIVYNAGTPGNYGCPTCIVPNASIGSGFPWPLRQAINICVFATAGSTVTCTFGSTPTSGDSLFAVAGWACNSGATITTPSGWTIAEGPSCNSGSGAATILYEKTSAGTESSVAFVQSGETGQTGMLIDFNGARTVDKVAESNADAGTLQFAALSSPTSGAGVMIFCTGTTEGTVATPLLFANGNVTGDWAVSYLTTMSYIQSMYGFWQNTVGTGTLIMPYCVVPNAGLASITMSLL